MGLHWIGTPIEYKWWIYNYYFIYFWGGWGHNRLINLNTKSPLSSIYNLFLNYLTCVIFTNILLILIIPNSSFSLVALLWYSKLLTNIIQVWNLNNIENIYLKVSPVIFSSIWNNAIVHSWSNFVWQFMDHLHLLH